MRDTKTSAIHCSLHYTAHRTVITSGVYIFSYRFNSYSLAKTGLAAIKKVAFSFLCFQVEGLAIHWQTQGRGNKKICFFNFFFFGFCVFVTRRFCQPTIKKKNHLIVGLNSTLNNNNKSVDPTLPDHCPIHCWHNVDLMLDHHLQSLPNTKPTLCQCLMDTHLL